MNESLGVHSKHVKISSIIRIHVRKRRKNLTFQPFNEPTLYMNSVTGGQGYTVDYKNIVIILTSNLRVKHLLLGLSRKCTIQVARNQVMQEIRRHFKLDLLNKLDEVIVFNPLSHEQLRKVSRLQIKDVASCLAKRGIALVVVDLALDYILAEIYDLVIYCARLIRRLLEKKVLTELSRMLVNEEIDVNSTVYINALNRSESVYRIENNRGLVNAKTGQKMDVLI
ncbi:LOW QUALITY PROTEIN: chaperone protein ClpB1 [Gossypium hirsutum]|uniref:LOW QUALITY PROTEIN: chaperone protein ClpB1 n=1 Tax=Gossypium hirsutum TaxID=3635 RepID=A0ABM3A590_GOSHI|nr:LOW QUALITY PROTEIN: chaperone protein ClpB1 [Gossypium hirsutum]